jgi:hypothetical protein
MHVSWDAYGPGATDQLSLLINPDDIDTLIATPCEKGAVAKTGL